MSNYSKTTDFEAKDSLPTGDSGKIIRGAEFETEFDAISTAIATKADTAGPTFTGTLTFETISDGTIGVTAFVDEDNMASNSATLVPTQQSVKAYVDSQVTAQDLDFQADSGGALSIDLDSETLTFTGGTGVDTSGSGNAVTFAIDSTVATLTGTQTLTNKTLTSPDINTPDIDGGTIDGTVIGGATPAAVSATTVSATGNITVGGTVDGRDVATDGTKLDGIEASADVTDTANVTAAGALMDSELTSIASVKALNQGVATTDSPTFAAVTVNGNVEFDGLSGTGSVTVTDILDQDDMSGNSATALATQQSIKAYVDSQVATADTLSEVLANGNTTGGTDVAFGDNDKAIFGAGSDLQIYHDGTNSYISDQGTNDLKVLATDFQLKNAADNEFMMTAVTDGAVTAYHNGSAKLATTSTGIDVTGSITTDGLTVDTSDQVIVNHSADGGGIRIDSTNDTNTGSLRFGDTADNYIGAVEYNHSTNTLSLYADNATRMAVNSTGIDVTGKVVSDGLDTSEDLIIRHSTTDHLQSILGTDGGGFAIEDNNYFAIWHQDIANVGTDTGLTQRFQIASNGDVSLYEDSGTTAKLTWDASAETLNFADNGKAIFGAGSDATLHSDGSIGYARGFVLQNTAGNKDVLSFVDGGATTLFHNNSAKLATTSTGIDVTGSVTADGLQLGDNQYVFLGDGSDGRLHFDGTDTVNITATNGTANVVNVAANSIKLVQANGTDFFTASANTEVVINEDSADIDFRVESNLNSHMLFVDAGNNRVGIGTSSPATPLHVESAVTNTNTVFVKNTAGTGVNYGLEIAAGTNATDHALHVTSSSGTSLLRVDGSGNVGIGTSSPSIQVDVENTVANSGGKLRLGTSDSSTSGVMGRLIFGNGNDIAQSIIEGISDGATDASALIFKTEATGGSETERMRITSAGNVGIGRTTDTVYSGSLQIAFGNGSQLATGTSGNPYLTLTDNSYLNASGNHIYKTSNPSTRLEQSNGTLTFSNAASGTAGNTITYAERMRIDSSGNVGIGTTSPSFINGSGLEIQRAGVATLRLEDTGSSGKAFELSVDDGTGAVVNSASSGLPMIFKVTNSEAMRLDTSGNLLVGTTNTLPANNNVEGIALSTGSYGGRLEASRSGGAPCSFNRVDSDGSVIEIRRAGSTVGSIGVNGDRIYFAGANEAVGIDDSWNAFVPLGTGGGNSDADTDLGNPSSRFKDLYLSGTVNVGGSTVIDNNRRILAADGAANVPYITFSSDTNTGLYRPSADVLGISTGGSERARIDNSGNFMVGKTSASFTTAGLELRNGGPAIFGRDQAEPLIVNRLTTDGGIVNFNKDGTTVGSIGSRSSVVSYIVLDPRTAYKGAGLTAASLSASVGILNPADKTGAIADNAINLGNDSSRFRDLYLSGGVFLGGTGSANKLDDYEEGTWTPSFQATTTTPTIESATYTKIGRRVHLQLYMTNISPATSGDIQYIEGLPFTTNGSDDYPAGVISYASNADVEGIGVIALTSATRMYFHYIDGTSASALTRNNWNSIKSSGLQLIISLSYNAA